MSSDTITSKDGLSKDFPLGEENVNYTKWFTGTSYLAGLGDPQLGASNVTFEPGCRNWWHIHHKGGQVLICIAGRGWYQEEGKPARELHPGDVVSIPPEVKHWHGAAKDSWFQHIALAVPAEGASAEWVEPVTDEQYASVEK
jgi:quercetin dioxygenase-like cupin family protein